MSHYRAFAVSLSAACLGVFLCNAPPAYAQFITKGQEAGIGAQEHPKIIKQFGGVYDEPKVSGYAATIGGRIVANSEQAKNPYHFTVLDSPVVNAFALPGGYVYITRGLMALANSEAELASVLAHEVGHVTARHSAQRQNKSMGVALGSAVLGALIGNPMVSNVINQGSQLYLLGYSRDQEYQADKLGIRYLVGAGYDPYAEADFLRNMEAQDALEKALSKGGKSRPVEFLSTHPQTAKRVEEAIVAARSTGLQVQARPRRSNEFLNVIDGMIFGDSPQHGYVKGRNFVHPQLGFAFTAPAGFTIVNQPDAVIAQGPEGLAIKFDMAPLQQAMSMPAYMTQIWGKGASLRNAEGIMINGMQGATAVTTVSSQSGAQANVRLVAIAFKPDTVARFMILMPKQPSGQMMQELQRATYSFRHLSASEAGSVRPQRIKIVQVRPGETIASLAERMPFEDYREARFRTLNGLDPNETLASGSRVKLIVE